MGVDSDRLREDLLQNAGYGAIETERGHGRTVLTGSAADRAAREHLVDQFEVLDFGQGRQDAPGTQLERPLHWSAIEFII